MVELTNNKIDKNLKETSYYFINGIKYPLFQSDNVLVSLITNYYVHRHNIAVISLSLDCAKIFKKILEILKTDKIAVISRKNLNIDRCFIPEEFIETNEEYIIFDNIQIPQNILNSSKAHLSIFVDFGNMNILSNIGFYNKYIQENHMNNDIIQEYSQEPEYFIVKNNNKILESIEEENNEFIKILNSIFIQLKNWTVICSKVKPIKVEFKFTTNDSLKRVSISTIKNEPGTLAYSKEPVNFKIENVEFIQKIDQDIKYKTFIMYDLNSDILRRVIKRMTNILIFYTKDDLNNLRSVVDILKEYNIEIPEYILRISNS